MVQFNYDRKMKRYDVLVKSSAIFKPSSLFANDFKKATEENEPLLLVAHIDEHNKITFRNHGIDISVIRNIFLHWDEYEFQLTKGDI